MATKARTEPVPSQKPEAPSSSLAWVAKVQAFGASSDACEHSRLLATSMGILLRRKPITEPRMVKERELLLQSTEQRAGQLSLISWAPREGTGKSSYRLKLGLQGVHPTQVQVAAVFCSAPFIAHQ